MANPRLLRFLRPGRKKKNLLSHLYIRVFDTTYAVTESETEDHAAPPPTESEETEAQIPPSPEGESGEEANTKIDSFAKLGPLKGSTTNFITAGADAR